jgi:hypothetical protein
VDSIVGNEVTLALGEPQKGGDTASSSSLEQGDQAQTGTEQSSDSGSQAPSGEMPSGEMPSGEMPSGQMPSGAAPSGKMPSGEMPSGQMPSGAGDSAQSGAQGGRSVTLDYSGETATYLLPVGMAIGTGDFSDVTVV